jgi:hypothetical protein
LKSWLQSGKKDKVAKKMYDEAVQVCNIGGKWCSVLELLVANFTIGEKN